MGTSEKSPTTVLVVEDEVLVRHCAVAQLTEAGFEVIAAGDAETALHAFERDPTVGTVFTDINLPGALDGLSLAHMLSRMRPEVRLIITSGLAPPKHTLPAGSHFLTKPYDCCVLPTLIKAA